MKCQWLVGVALLGAVVLTGCAETKNYKNYSEEVNSWTYQKTVAVTFKDWYFDLNDIWTAELGGGETIGLDVQPTELLQFGALFGDVLKVGWRDRAFGFYREVHKEGGATWFYYRSMRMEPVIGTPSLFERHRLFQGFPIRFNDEWHWADIRIEGGLIFVHASLGVSPKHAVDFLLTTLQLPINLCVRYPVAKAYGFDMPDADLCEDDTRAQIRKKYDVELIPVPEMFEPSEEINDWVHVPTPGP